MKNTENQKETQRVAMYIRVSTDEQVEKFGHDLQFSSIKSIIESRSKFDRNLVFAGDQYVYFDEGISGTVEIEQRPAFARLQEDILNSTPDNKPFDVVAVYKIDRFARRLKILLDVIDFFDENDIKFLSVNESIDTSTPFGKAMLGIIGVIAELEIATTKQRTQDGREEAVKSGVVLGNATVFGYKKNPDKRAEIFKDEADTVKLIFSLFINERLTSGLIARRLKEMEILSPEESAVRFGKRKGTSKKKNKIYHWTPTAVLRILADDIYVGNYYYNKSKGGKIKPKPEWSLSPYVIPSIIDDLSFYKAQKILKQSKHEKPITITNHTYLLSGLLVCDTCYDPISDKTTGRRHWVGTGKKIKSTNKHTYTYNCGRKNRSKYDIDTMCPTLPLPAKEIEDYVVNFTKNLLKNPLATFEYQNRLKSTKKNIEHLEKQEAQYRKLIEGIPGRKENLLSQHEHSYIDIKKLNAEMKSANSDLKIYEEKIRDIHRNLSEYNLSVGYTKSLELFSQKYKPALDDMYKSRTEVWSILHTLIEEIVVYSRPITEKDTVAGIRREGQRIPDRLHIKLKLPQEIIQELAVRGENTSVVRDAGLEPATFPV